MNNLEFKVSEDQSDQRLDVFLAELLPERSRGRIQKDIVDGRVSVQGIVVLKAKKLVHTGDDVALDEDNRQETPSPEARDLSVIFEDESIIVINKPAGMVVHPNQAEGQGTLVQALLNYYPAISQAIYDDKSAISHLRPGIVHRLDKDTSGVIVVAKTQPVLMSLAQQFQEHGVEKEYVTLVEGEVGEKQEIRTLLKRTKDKSKNLMGVNQTGRLAITHIIPEAAYRMPNGRIASMLRCQIETGRTHQIRVHCKHIGHPVLGDPLYSSKTSADSSKRLGLGRQMLHAATLRLTHPVSGERMVFQAPLPADMVDVLTRLEPVW